MFCANEQSQNANARASRSSTRAAFLLTTLCLHCQSSAPSSDESRNAVTPSATAASSVAATVAGGAPDERHENATDTRESDHGDDAATAARWLERHHLPAVRGITIGPIESGLHPDRGYGSAEMPHALSRIKRMGSSWVSLTPFGRIWDLEPSGVDRTFEQPWRKNRQAVRRAIEQAHAAGFKVMLVPHLWAETGAWRGEIDPGDDAGWARWAKGYERFLTFWAKQAQETGVELLSIGVELRTWATTSHAPSLLDIIAKVRRIYSGQLTYAANWDDAERTVIWGALDVIGINAFYPLAHEPGASGELLLDESRKVRDRVREWTAAWGKPVLFTEVGYTTRTDPALRPWEWPEDLGEVRLDQKAQAEAYRALLAPFLDESWFLGFFVWRLFPDLYDMSQEPEWGFSPFGKSSELVVRDAFATAWGADGRAQIGAALLHPASMDIGLY